MKLAGIFEDYPLDNEYLDTMSREQWQAYEAVMACRTEACGEMLYECPCCHKRECRYHSCGNRFCPSCQNHDTGRWLKRQEEKLLPGHYMFETFTVPSELRPVAYANQKLFYRLMFEASSETLITLGKDPKYLGAQVGMTGVLHTHSRAKNFHPHIHYIMPGGGFDVKRNQWVKTRYKYLFPVKKMSSMFRSKLLSKMRDHQLPIPWIRHFDKWVTHAKVIDKGSAGLRYLSHYVYRGVMSEKDIIENKDGFVTFRYIDSETGEEKRRKLRGATFVKLLLQHVLPGGFRRVRDYGFLNGKCRLKLQRIQLHLRVRLNPPSSALPPLLCPKCRIPMKLIATKLTHKQIAARGPPNHVEYA